MTITTCLLALAVLGSGDSNDSGESHVLIRVKSLEMKGVDWRGAVASDLQPCARQGTATIWTADDSTAATIIKSAAKVIDTPRITTVPGTPASIVDEVNRNYVAEFSRGSVGNPSSASYHPKIQTVRDGWRGAMTCRPLDQGVLANISIDATQFMAFHPVTSTGEYPVEGKTEPQHFKAQYQVPEVASSHVSGDWLIPNHGCLVIAFGVHTATNAEGKTAATERVLLIQAEPFSSEPTPVAVARPQLTAAPDLRFPIGTILPGRMATIDARVGKLSHVPAYATTTGSSNHDNGLTAIHDSLTAIAVTLASPTTNAPVAVAPMPKVPSRGIPQAFSANGTPVELPALPDSALETVSGTDDSSEPRPSPQSLHGLKNFVLKSLAGLSSADVEELFSLIREHEDEFLCPIDDDVKTTSTTPPPASTENDVRRFTLGGGIVVEVPAKYLLKNVGAGRE